MNADQIDSLTRRASVHADLADPARLLITDTLLAGEASPSELAAMLAMPSNLIAHHLGVLEQAGIIARRRSEGDRRCTYLRLISGPPDPLPAAAPRSARRVLFVCTANTARSHFAAALWRKASAVPAASAGTHPAEQIDPGAIDAAGRHHLPMRRLRPRHMSDVQQEGDFVITVCDLAREELGQQAALHSSCCSKSSRLRRPSATPRWSTLVTWSRSASEASRSDFDESSKSGGAENPGPIDASLAAPW